MMEDLKEKIKNFIINITKREDNNDEDKEKTFNEIKEFTIEVGCELFNKTKEDFEKLMIIEYSSFLYDLKLHNEDRTLASIYMALCNLLYLYRPESEKYKDWKK